MSGAEAWKEIPIKSKDRSSTVRFFERIQWQAFIAILLINDLVMAGLAFRAAYYVRFELAWVIFKPSAPSVPFYSRLVLYVMPVWILILVASGLYDRKNLLTGITEYAGLFSAVNLGIFLFIAVGFLGDDIVFARGWLVLAWLFSFFLIGLGRFLIRRLVRFLRGQGYYLARTIVVGCNSESWLLSEQLQNRRISGLDIVGYVDDEALTDVPSSVKYRHLGMVKDLQTIIHEYNIHDVILTSSALSRDKLTEVFRSYSVYDGVRMHLSSGLYEIITTGFQVHDFAGVSLLDVNRVRLTGVDQMLKMLMDYSLTIFLIIICSPFLLASAIAIKLDSPGKVIYRRRVMGVNGRQFDAFKFRTMYVNGDQILDQYPDLKAELKANQKLKDDPRITRVGKILRQNSIDELPQLFNVLRNEMTLVGPRMISPEELEKYGQWGMNLLTVKPGITGLWQISGRSDLSYDRRIQLDMHYVRNWSIWLDGEILWLTIPAVIKRRGAY